MNKNLLMSFTALGIIGGDQKSYLADYVDARFFTQRKSYDEYYIDVDEVEFDNLTIWDLVYLSGKFKIEISDDLITLYDR